MPERPLKVMLVEDSPSDAELLRDSLAEAVANGMVISQAECLKEALERLSTEGFDVLLLDLHLPDSTGPDTFIRARAAAPRLPIILFTGMDDETMGAQALHQGIQDYLVKGQVDGRQILRAIRYAIERKRAEDALGASEAALQRLNKELQTNNEMLEQRVAERTAELRKRTAQLQSLASQITRAEERERRRIAQVLHDDLQQMLVAARFNLESLCSRHPAQPIHKELRDVWDMISQTLKVSRSLTTELNPAILHQAGLGAALKWLGGWYEEKHGLVVTVEIEQPLDIESEEIRVALFQSVRELLFNVVKHAQVKTARICLRRAEDGTARIVVSDQGIGFDPAQVQAQEGTAGTFGLFSLRERIELLGGRFEVDSAPGKGSRCTLLAP